MVSTDTGNRYWTEREVRSRSLTVVPSIKMMVKLGPLTSAIVARGMKVSRCKSYVTDGRCDHEVKRASYIEQRLPHSFCRWVKGISPLRDREV